MTELIIALTTMDLNLKDNISISFESEEILDCAYKKIENEADLLEAKKVLKDYLYDDLPGYSKIEKQWQLNSDALIILINNKTGYTCYLFGKIKGFTVEDEKPQSNKKINYLH